MKLYDRDIKSQKASVLVTGGTGLLGKEVCRMLGRNGTAYVIGTHQQDNLNENFTLFDLESGEGMQNALAGKNIIFHLASDKKHPENDVNGTIKMLNEIKKQGGSPHLIYISIVGVDMLPMAYFREKYETEEAIKSSGIPFSILRATQFHDYLSDVISMFLKIPFIALIPKKMPVQPIDVCIVADKLVEISHHPPMLNTENFGGKDIFSFSEAVSAWLLARDKCKLILNLPLWGSWGKNLNRGALTTPFKITRGKDWRRWLKQDPH